MNYQEVLKMKKYIIEQTAETTWFYTFTDVNEKGEKLVIELSKCKDWKESKNSLAKLWKKHGYINRVLETYWFIQTYVKNTEGNSFEKYNPQRKLGQINFDWMFEATEENKEKLINEVYRLFSTAKGLTATQEKNKRIKDYAIKNNIQIYKTIPEGWKELNGCLTAPIGTVWISNIATFRSGNRKRGICLD